MADLTIGARIFEHAATQDLNLAALDTTSAFATDTKLNFVTIHADGPITQDIIITIDSLNGTAFDTIIWEEKLSSETDFIYQPDLNLFLKKGSEIRVQVTNTATPNRTVGVVIGVTQE